MANTNCDKLSEALSAYVDGELSPQESRIIVRHLENCAACRERLTARLGLEQRLLQTCSAERAPDGLWDKVMTSVCAATPDASGQDAPPADPSWGTSQFGRRRSIGIAAGVLLVLGAGVSVPFWSRFGGKNPLIVEPVNDFITFQVSERPLDMAASDPAALKKWFKGKVDFRLPLKDAEIDGYRLVGSRLCYFLNRRLSALMYERPGARISLYVMTGEGLEIPKGTWEPTASRQIATFAVENYRNLIWQEGDLVYALVSNQPKDDMLRFVAGLNFDATAASHPVSKQDKDRRYASLRKRHRGPT